MMEILDGGRGEREDARSSCEKCRDTIETHTHIHTYNNGWSPNNKIMLFRHLWVIMNNTEQNVGNQHLWRTKRETK